MEFKKNEKLSRKHLANPWADKSFVDRLIDSGAVDLRDNHKTIDHGNGYVQIVPIDETKLWTKESYEEYIQSLKKD